MTEQNKTPASVPAPALSVVVGSGLSPTMKAAVDAAYFGGERRLYRWPGGYWMPRRKEMGDVSPAHGTYHGTQTVHALLKRGVMRGVEFMTRSDPWIVEISDPNTEARQPGRTGYE